MHKLNFLWLPGWSYQPDMYNLVISDIDKALGKQNHISVDFSKCQQASDIYQITSSYITSAHQKTVVVGWSMGAMAAQASVNEKSDHISLLFLISSSPAFIRNSLFPSQIKERQLRSLEKRVINDPLRAVSDFRNSIRSKRTTGISMTSDDMPIRWNKESLLAGLDFLASYQIDLSVSKAVNIPVSILHGEEDFICPPNGALELAKIYRKSNLSILRRIGHDIPLIEPKGLASRIIEAILSRHLI